MTEFAPHAEYIDVADILMVRLSDRPVARTLTLGHWRNIDLDSDGHVIAAEFINAAGSGVDLAGVPEAEALSRLIREAAIPALSRK